MNATVDTTDLDYQIGVMQAAKAGKKIEFRSRGSTVWMGALTPSWDWARCEFRVEPDSLAPLFELAQRWATVSVELREKATAHKNAYGSGNYIFVANDHLSNALKECSTRLLECLQKLKEDK